MLRVNAVSLSMSQGGGPLNAYAFLSVREDDNQTMMKVEWHNLGVHAQDLDPATWLLQALEAVVANFDDHVVSHVDVVGSSMMQEDRDA